MEWLFKNLALKVFKGIVLQNLGILLVPLKCDHLDLNILAKC